MLASRPAQGRDSVAPDVALWLLEEAGPHRLTDPETLDVASSGADLEVIGPDFLVRRLTRGRTHLLRVARDGAVTTVLDGDVSVEGADAVAIDSGTLVAAALSTPDTRGALVAVEGRARRGRSSIPARRCAMPGWRCRGSWRSRAAADIPSTAGSRPRTARAPSRRS